MGIKERSLDNGGVHISRLNLMDLMLGLLETPT